VDWQAAAAFVVAGFLMGCGLTGGAMLLWDEWRHRQ